MPGQEGERKLNTPQHLVELLSFLLSKAVEVYAAFYDNSFCFLLQWPLGAIETPKCVHSSVTGRRDLKEGKRSACVLQFGEDKIWDINGRWLLSVSCVSVPFQAKAGYSGAVHPSTTQTTHISTNSTACTHSTTAGPSWIQCGCWKRWERFR